MDIVKLAVAILFIVTYLLIVFFYEKKARIIWSAIILLLLFGVLSPIDAFKSINLNVLGIYVGMLFISEAFIFSKVPDFLSVFAINKARRISTVLLIIAAFSGLLSVVIENVAVVLITAPIALAITRRLKISPVPLLIAIAVSSNLQGVATLIGDPPSMIMAAYAKMTFNDFFFIDGKPSLFFAVQIGAIASLAVLYFFFRKYNHPHERFPHINPRSYFPLAIIVSLVILLALSSFYDPSFSYLAGLITIVLGMVALLWYSYANKGHTMALVKRVDWETGFFLAGVFILVESLIQAGLIEDAARLIAGIVGSSVALTFIIIICVSLLFSAFIDNVPYIATMLPVIHKVAEIMGVNPMLLYFGLLLGASIGGNITPVGASANIVAMGIAKREGYHPTFWEFVKIGLPFTIVSTLASTFFVWIIFG